MSVLRVPAMNKLIGWLQTFSDQDREQIARAMVVTSVERAAALSAEPSCNHVWHTANITGQKRTFLRCAICYAEKGHDDNMLKDRPSPSPFSRG